MEQRLEAIRDGENFTATTLTGRTNYDFDADQLSLSPYIHGEWQTTDLTEKMVFVDDPRQVGKTTLAFSLLQAGSNQHPAYLNWDIPSHHKALMKGELPASEPLIVLDEIHKYSRWRNLVKGYYDQHHRKRELIAAQSNELPRNQPGSIPYLLSVRVVTNRLLLNGKRTNTALIFDQAVFASLPRMRTSINSLLVYKT